jgi:hypothetical protein
MYEAFCGRLRTASGGLGVDFRFFALNIPKPLAVGHTRLLRFVPCGTLPRWPKQPDSL